MSYRTATGRVNRMEFGISYTGPIPGGGVTLGEQVQIVLEIEAVLQPSTTSDPRWAEGISARMSSGRPAFRLVDDRADSEGDNEMGKVTTGGTMSLDGYIAGPAESGFDLLFQWYGNGDVEIPSASPNVPPPRISAASAELIGPEWENTGALVVGRHLYDMTNAWGGRHPMNVTTVVLTHRRPDDRPDDDENFVFVTDGIEAAVATAKKLAGDKDVAVNGGQMARQCLEAGLLDEVGVELVPVVLGAGTPLFAELTATPVQFDGPVAVVEGTGVTHLRYKVKK